MHDDKVKHEADEATGKVKEGLGRATGDASLEREGERDRAEAHLGKAAGKVKDSFTDR